MKKQIRSLYLIVLLSLVFPITKSVAQTTFTFDTLNTTFFKVTTNTETGVTTIILKANDSINKRIMEYENASISFSYKPTNIKVDFYNGEGSHQSRFVRAHGTKYRVKEMKRVGINVLIIELQFPMENISEEEKFMLGMLPNDEEMPNFKFETIELK